MWIVQMPIDDWENATCTCPMFSKNYICKHTLGIAIQLKKFAVVVEEAKSVPIGEKRKRGRPKLAKALLRQ